MKLSLFIFLCFFLLVDNTPASGSLLPVPGGAVRKHEQQLVVNGITYDTEIYQLQLLPEEAFIFYEQALPPQGFVLISKRKSNLMNTLLFALPKTEENFTITITKDAKTGLSRLSIARFKGDQFSENLSAFAGQEVAKDTPGTDDLADIPRYPGTVRTQSVDINNNTRTAYYNTTHAKEDVLSFYEKEMPSYGWKRLLQEKAVKERVGKILAADKAFDAAKMLMFEKGEKICSIMVVSPGEGCSGPKNMLREGNIIGIGTYTRRR